MAETLLRIFLGVKLVLGSLAPLRTKFGESIPSLLELMRSSWDYMIAVLEEKTHLISPPMEWRRKMGGLSEGKHVPKLSENRAFR
jgi:hypothetical protein